MIKLYYLYLLLTLLLGVLSWAIPVSILIYQTDPSFLSLFLGLAVVPLILLILLTAIWVPFYYRSLVYRVEDNMVYARRGVIWTRESRVPISKVNDVVLTQGPFQRMFGLANLGFHTAAMGTLRPEVLFSNISVEDAKKVRKMVLEAIKKAKPLEKPKTVEEQILEELKNIRKLLEKLVETS